MNRPWPGGHHHDDCAKQSTLLEVLSAVQQLSRSVNHLSVQMGKLMSQDADILALAQAIQGDNDQLAQALVSIQTAVATLQGEVAAGGNNAISDSTMQALNDAKTGLDTAVAQAVANAQADNPAPADGSGTPAS